MTSLSGLPFLGQIVTFTVGDASVDLEQMHEALGSQGLQVTLLKSKLRRVDAFKKAVNELAVKFPRSENGTQQVLLVRATGQDSAESHRHVLLETTVCRAGQRRQVTHDTIFRVLYDRGTRTEDGHVVNDSIFVEEQFVPGLRLTDEVREWIDNKIGHDGTALRARFEHLSAHLDGHGIRTFVRAYLEALGAIKIKEQGGGLYFVREANGSELRRLATFLRAMNTTMHLIPLVDTPEQRSMLKDAAALDIADSARALSGEGSKVLLNSTRSITRDRFEAMEAQVHALSVKARDYSALLDTPLPAAEAAIDDCLATTIRPLSERVAAPKALRSTSQR